MTSNTQVSRDLRGKAYSVTGRCPNGALAPDGDLSYCSENQVSQPQAVEPATPVQNNDNPPAQAPQTPTALDVSDGTCLGPGQSCQNGNYFDIGCPVTETRCGTKPVQAAPITTATPQQTIAPIQTTTPTQTVTAPEIPDVPDGTCLEPGQSCQNGNYFDSGCPVTETRCGTKPAPAAVSAVPVAPAVQNTVTSPPSTVIVPVVPDGKCLDPGQSCQNGDYFDIGCPVTETRCGTKPVQTTSQTPTPSSPSPQTTTTPSTYTLNIACKTCNSNKQCVTRVKPCNEDLNQCTTHQDCGTVWVCQQNETQCQDTQILLTCKSDQTGWLTKTCEYGCENNGCKTKTLLANGASCTTDSQCSSNNCVLSGAAANADRHCTDPNVDLTATYNTLNTVTFGAFGNYVQANQNVAAQNPDASYLEKVFDPQNIAASTKLGTVITAEAAIVAAAVPYIPTILATTNVIDDVVTLAQCATGDQNACAMIIPTLTIPIPGVGLIDDVSDAARSWDLLTPNTPRVNPGWLDPIEDTSNFHLANVDTPTTSLDEAIALDNQMLFAEGAYGPTGKGTYTSLGGERLEINPSTDPTLKGVLTKLNDRYPNGVSVEELNTRTHDSLRFANPDQPYLEATQLREELYAPGSPVKLGEFIKKNTGVCREFSACLHVYLANSGTPSYMVVGDVNSIDGVRVLPGRHAWVEYIDPQTQQWMVADPTNNWIRTRDVAYAQMFLGAANIQRQVFVWPEGTSLVQRLSGKIAP